MVELRRRRDDRARGVPGHLGRAGGGSQAGISVLLPRSQKARGSGGFARRVGAGFSHVTSQPIALARARNNGSPRCFDSSPAGRSISANVPESVDPRSTTSRASHFENFTKPYSENRQRRRLVPFKTQLFSESRAGLQTRPTTSCLSPNGHVNRRFWLPSARKSDITFANHES